MCENRQTDNHFLVNSFKKLQDVNKIECKKTNFCGKYLMLKRFRLQKCIHSNIKWVLTYKIMRIFLNKFEAKFVVLRRKTKVLHMFKQT